MAEEKSKDLFVAAFCGDLPRVKLLCNDPSVDLNSLRQGYSPFYSACWEKKPDIVKFMLGLEGIDPNLTNYKGTTPLSIACRDGHEDVVSLLLADHRVDINQSASDGSTPLWRASQNGYLTIVQMILASGRQIDTTKPPRERVAKMEKYGSETEEEFQTRKANYPKIVDLIDAYEKDPAATISKIRNEFRLWNRRKRVIPEDDEKQQEEEEEREKLVKKVKRADSKKRGVENLQSMSKCSICCQVLKTPKTLPCVHSFCLGCLEKQTKTTSPPYQCGICTAPFLIPKKGLKSLGTSPLLANLLTSSSPSLSSSSSSSSTAGANFDPNDVTCGLCDDNEDATFHCDGCDQFLGPRCAASHRKIPSTKHHHLQPIDEYFTKSRAKKATATAKPTTRCQEHPILEIDTYCKTCEEVVCAKCLALAHSGHEFCSLSEESERLKGELIDMTSTIASREKEAEKGRKIFAQSLGKVKKGRKGAEEGLERAFESLQAELDQRKAVMLGKLDDRCCEVEKVSELEKEELEFALSEFKGYRDMSESILAAGSDVEVAASHSMLMTRGETLEEIGFLTEPSLKPDIIKFNPKNLYAVKKAISTFGVIE